MTTHRDPGERARALEAELSRRRRAVLIVNTHSRRGAKVYEQAARALTAAGLQLDGSHAVRHPDRLPGLVQAAVAAGHRFVIVGGGDGTVSAAVDHVAYADVVFGVLPVGTANSFARTLGIPLDVAGAVDVLVNGRVIPVDLGRIDGDFFANGSSIGLPVAIARAAPRALKRWLGRATYVLVAVPEFARLRPFRCVLRVGDEERAFDALDVRIASGRYQGGVLVAGEARLDDGQLVVHVHRGTSKWGLAREWARVIFGLPLAPADLVAVRAARLTLDASPPQDVAIDGEVLARTPIRIEAAARALLVRVPHGSDPRPAAQEGPPLALPTE